MIEFYEFKIGDIAIGNITGNHVRIEDIDYDEGVFSGTVIEVATTRVRYNIGEHRDDWCLDCFKLESGFWRL